MFHPFQRLSPEKRPPLFWSLLAVTLLLMVFLNLIGTPLITDEAPLGIVSYEIAGNVNQAGMILDSWDQSAKMHAALSLGLDYLFLVVYSTTIGLACIWASDVLRARGWPLVSLGPPLAWGQWLAALLDVIENLALILILFGTLNSPWPELAKWCAVVKFSLVFAGLIYAFFALVVSVVHRLNSER